MVVHASDWSFVSAPKILMVNTAIEKVAILLATHWKTYTAVYTRKTFIVAADLSTIIYYE